MSKFKIGDQVFGKSDDFHVHTRQGVGEVVGISRVGTWKMYHVLRPGENPQEARYGSRAIHLVHAADVDLRTGVVKF